MTAFAHLCTFSPSHPALATATEAVVSATARVVSRRAESASARVDIDGVTSHTWYERTDSVDPAERVSYDVFGTELSSPLTRA